MEIKIVITKKTKEQILKLIDQLVDWEAKSISENFPKKGTIEQIEAPKPIELIGKISEGEGITVAEPEIEKRLFGAWGMFNSFVPGKAALRVLVNLQNQNPRNQIKFPHLVDECITFFSKSGLYKYRGFPKRTSESARGRLVSHLLLPYSAMGLMNVKGSKKTGHVIITKEGLAFAQLKNPLLDETGKKRPLSKEESNWLIKYLKEIDSRGYKEFSLLLGLTEFLANSKREFGDIVDWFSRKENFIKWLRETSRYRDDPKAFSRQLDNVARTFASGKIALLRELGILSTARATYRVLHGLEEEKDAEKSDK